MTLILVVAFALEQARVRLWDVSPCTLVRALTAFRAQFIARFTDFTVQRGDEGEDLSVV